MSDLTFDEATHTYRHKGLVVPGVTSVLKPLSGYGSVPAAVLEAAAEFGTAVHKACELWDLGTLDEEALDPALAPYLDGWKKFCADHQVRWTSIEQPVFHPGLRYAGAPDRRGFVQTISSTVDIKTTDKLYPSVGPQLAAYQAAEETTPGVLIHQRLAVRLVGDGTYEKKAYVDPSDFSVFASLLTIRNWCDKHQVTPTY